MLFSFDNAALGPLMQLLAVARLGGTHLSARIDQAHVVRCAAYDGESLVVLRVPLLQPTNDRLDVVFDRESLQTALLVLQDAGFGSPVCHLRCDSGSSAATLTSDRALAQVDILSRAYPAYEGAVGAMLRGPRQSLPGAAIRRQHLDLVKALMPDHQVIGWQHGLTGIHALQDAFAKTGDQLPGFGEDQVVELIEPTVAYGMVMSDRILCLMPMWPAEKPPLDWATELAGALP